MKNLKNTKFTDSSVIHKLAICIEKQEDRLDV